MLYLCCCNGKCIILLEIYTLGQYYLIHSFVCILYTVYHTCSLTLDLAIDPCLKALYVNSC